VRGPTVLPVSLGEAEEVTASRCSGGTASSTAMT
jgi:hypothetical protein